VVLKIFFEDIDVFITLILNNSLLFFRKTYYELQNVLLIKTHLGAASVVEHGRVFIKL